MNTEQGQVRGQSLDGADVASSEIALTGYKPNTYAHIVLTGWSFKFDSGDHNILEMGLWLQQAEYGSWKWCHDVRIHPDGTAKARYIGFAGSENRDNPFTFLVNYLVMGERA